jgi:hypothetical protein
LSVYAAVAIIVGYFFQSAITVKPALNGITLDQTIGLLKPDFRLNEDALYQLKQDMYPIEIKQNILLMSYLHFN